MTSYDNFSTCPGSQTMMWKTHSAQETTALSVVPKAHWMALIRHCQHWSHWHSLTERFLERTISCSLMHWQIRDKHSIHLFSWKTLHKLLAIFQPQKIITETLKEKANSRQGEWRFNTSWNKWNPVEYKTRRTAIAEQDNNPSSLLFSFQKRLTAAYERSLGSP